MGLQLFVGHFHGCDGRFVFDSDALVLLKVFSRAEEAFLVRQFLPLGLLGAFKVFLGLALLFNSLELFRCRRLLLAWLALGRRQ